MPCRAFGPLHQLEPWAGEKFAKPGILPFARIGETVKIEVPNVQRRARWHQRAGQRFVGFDHRIGGAFDAPLHTQRAQQMAHEGRFAGAQIAVQREGGVGHGGAGGKVAGEGCGVGLAGPLSVPRAGRRLPCVPGKGLQDRVFGIARIAGGGAAAQGVVCVLAEGRKPLFSQIALALSQRR